MQQLTDKQKKERKFLLALPILTLPFLCLAFWAMGGGSGEPSIGEQQQGLNMTLPEAQVESPALTKLESYEQAEVKASKVREQRRMDPFAESAIEEEDASPRFIVPIGQESRLQETENEVQEKMFTLEKLLNQPDVQQKPAVQVIGSVETEEPGKLSDSADPDLQRLEALMASVTGPGLEDPEMERIDAMLDKLLDVQHPQRVHERMSQTNDQERKPVFAVSLDQDDPQADSPKESVYSGRERNGFYSLESETPLSFARVRPAIAAQVTKDQEVVTGASIEMELTQSMFIDGVEFSAGTPITGVCTLDGERLTIAVRSIRSGNLIVPVDLEVVDLDALPGIKIPNAITRDAVKQGAGEGIQSMNRIGMSSSWEAQASMAGMETVKGILSKKAKLVKVMVKAGHPLLLSDQSVN
ncbi:Bacteroides conjugative transposon TraM protein [Algoriphagus locisalis]|uniref:Bacteroides conjugative transposon TraM protein n=1 Tax=Algoriphagus locisalis TaxID=305507 RepID=A0A1I7E5K3_9BACT|nr:conjugative transposon protein TraM [Algoriphagus locisalis]SFU19218.1 Bacteroides conjugative transposon TraM protein [Algoriphagus locisalis]